MTYKKLYKCSENISKLNNLGFQKYGNSSECELILVKDNQTTPFLNFTITHSEVRNFHQYELISHFFDCIIECDKIKNTTIENNSSFKIFFSEALLIYYHIKKVERESHTIQINTNYITSIFDILIQLDFVYGEDIVYGLDEERKKFITKIGRGDPSEKLFADCVIFIQNDITNSVYNPGTDDFFSADKKLSRFSSDRQRIESYYDCLKRKKDFSFDRIDFANPTASSTAIARWTQTSLCGLEYQIFKRHMRVYFVIENFSFNDCFDPNSDHYNSVTCAEMRWVHSNMNRLGDYITFVTNSRSKIETKLNELISDIYNNFKRFIISNLKIIDF